VVTDGSAVEAGAGVVRRVGKPDVVLVGTGSEVSVCLAAADRLQAGGLRASVVSMPSWDRFAAQPSAARRSVFPRGVPVLSVEAASTFGWSAFADHSVGIDRFGASAPGATVLDKLGINPTNVAAAARKLIVADRKGTAR
jgi:transketolase